MDSFQELSRVESTQSNGCSPLQHFNKDAMEEGGGGVGGGCEGGRKKTRTHTCTSRYRGRESIAIIRGQVQW